MSRVQYLDSARAEWGRRTQGLRPSRVDGTPFDALFDRYLPRRPGASCLEVGALPGSFLVRLHKRFGYDITGIDFAENVDVFHETMRLNDIHTYTFEKVDFFDYRPPQQFDVVASFGFIEHFDDLDGVVQRHCDLVADGGHLVLTAPNFRYARWVYQRLFDKPNLAIHNIEAMKPDRIHEVAARNGFSKVFSGYTGGAVLWRDSGELDRFRALLDRVVRRLVSVVGRVLPESRFSSAYMVLIYQRASAGSPREP